MSSATKDTADTAPADGLDQVEAILAEVLSGLEPDLDVPVGRGRPRILPDLALWGGLVVCVARGFSSQLAIWRLLTQTG